MNPINESFSAISERLYYLLQDFEEEIEVLSETDEKEFHYRLGYQMALRDVLQPVEEVFESYEISQEVSGFDVKWQT